MSRLAQARPSPVRQAPAGDPCSRPPRRASVNRLAIGAQIKRVTP